MLQGVERHSWPLPPDANSSTPSNCDKQRCLRTLPAVPGRGRGVAGPVIELMGPCKPLRSHLGELDDGRVAGAGMWLGRSGPAPLVGLTQLRTHRSPNTAASVLLLPPSHPAASPASPSLPRWPACPRGIPQDHALGSPASELLLLQVDPPLGCTHKRSSKNCHRDG